MKPPATIITDSILFLNRSQNQRVEGCSIFQQVKIPWKVDIAGGRGVEESREKSFNQIQLSVRKCSVGKYSVKFV